MRAGALARERPPGARTGPPPGFGKMGARGAERKLVTDELTRFGCQTSPSGHGLHEVPVDEQNPHDAYVERTSVAELIARRLDEHDPWRLALVQRHLVWDEVRMAHLLDSLLAGYPIGSLLVCRVRQEAHVLRESGVTRVAEKARAGTWQLLDGQQRVNALIALFTDRAHFGRFYLDMTRQRVPEEVVTRRRDARRALDYIAWRSDDAGGTEPPGNRERFVELARLQGWAAAQAPGDVLDRARALQAEPQAAIAILNDIDPAFADELAPAELKIAADRTARLLRAWAEPSIPVQYFTVDSPSDVLQVFSRINLAGVRLDGEDVFFAAVKTEWPNAEEHLDRVAAASPLLNRMTALRLLARLASRASSSEDLLPLRVDRLNGPKGRQLVTLMEQLAADDSPVLARIGVLGRLLTTESAIGHGLALVDDGLLDHAFGWAAVNPAADDEDAVRPHLPSVEGYLLGAHAFRYPSIFRDGFLRLGFAEAVAAGAGARPFPTEQIVAGARRRWHGLRRGQNWVASIDDDAQRRRFVDQNAALFLSLLQGIPYAMPVRDPDDLRRGARQVEWDHIYPQAKANRMRVPHPVTGRRVHHADRSLVWSGGNLWALDRPINNFASDAYPSQKFELLETLPDAARHLPSPWPATDLTAITATERADLLEAERLIAADQVEAGMPRFRSYVERRSRRIFEAVVGRYPAIGLFATSAVIDPDLFEEAPAMILWDHLGLGDVLQPAAAEPEEPEPEEHALLAEDQRFASVVAAAERAGIADELRVIISKANDLGLVPRAYASSVMVAPRANKTRMLFTVWPQASDGGRFSIYRWAPAIAEFFPEIDEAAARDALGPDGYGILEREGVPDFLTKLTELVGSAPEGEGGHATQLTGEEIQAIAEEWLRAVDPERHGVHYYEIARAVEREGAVSGKNRVETVRSAISRNGRAFDLVSPGTYTWVPSDADRATATARPTRYWALRTDQNRRRELWAEIRRGRLRQGWGWDPEMDLELIAERMAAGESLSDWQQQAWGNRRMLTSQRDGMRVGDLIAVLHMPERGRLSLVRIVGRYEFDGGQLLGDYGHILPVELLTDDAGIAYSDPRLPSRLRSSIGNRIRLWSLDAFSEDLQRLAAHDGAG